MTRPKLRATWVAHVGDPRIEPVARIEHHVDEIAGKLDMDVIEIQQIADRALMRLGVGHRFGCRVGGGAAPHQHEADPINVTAPMKNGTKGRPGNSANSIISPPTATSAGG